MTCVSCELICIKQILNDLGVPHLKPTITKLPYKLLQILCFKSIPSIKLECHLIHEKFETGRIASVADFKQKFGDVISGDGIQVGCYDSPHSNLRSSKKLI